MAMDWIKMRTDLYRNPKVCVMADLLISPTSELSKYVDQNMQRDMTVTRNVMRNAVVGALVSIWGILRHRGKREIDDLVVTGCTLAVIDDLSEIQGFGEVMLEVDWIKETSDGFVLPRFFEEMNVNPDEELRAKNAERQRRHREKAKENSNVTHNVTVTQNSNAREEKRRVNNNSQFDGFWSAYGKKKGKAASIAQWKKISPDDDLSAVIIQAAKDVATSIEVKFRKDPERWLRGRHWEDEIVTLTKPKIKTLEELHREAM